MKAFQLGHYYINETVPDTVYKTTNSKISNRVSVIWEVTKDQLGLTKGEIGQLLQSLKIKTDFREATKEEIEQCSIKFKQITSVLELENINK